MALSRKASSNTTVASRIIGSIPVEEDSIFNRLLLSAKMMRGVNREGEREIMKIIRKFCEVCQETYSEKFNFCRFCGNPLKSIEVIQNEPKGNVSSTTEAFTPVNVVGFLSKTDPLGLVSEIKIKAPTRNLSPSFDQEDLDFSDQENIYQLTFIEEKNSATRNLLLLASLILVTTTLTAGVIWSLFDKNLFISDLGNNDLVSAVVVDETPMEVETEQEQQKKKDEGGGGGGGGREEPDPISKGRLAPQTQNPLISPTKTIPQMNTELKIQAFTQGPERPMKVTEEPYGDPLSQSYKLSDGPGRGGGQGSGIGTGQGSGIGTGAGSGRGSGMGSGIGTGIGSGTGDGEGSDDNEPPTAKKGPTKPLTILSKPRANYTEEARKNQVQGVVRLRVTFLANGTIGSITTISGLPYGLTEQAIAAARQIKFEPAMKNGVPQTVTRTIEYVFNLY